MTIKDAILCRREASLVPNYVLRINATTEYYRRDLRTKRQGRRKCVPGVGKSLRSVQRERHDSATITQPVTDWTTTRGKTDHPARPSLCASHADNDVSFVGLIFRGNSFQRDAALITGNAGVVAVGESLRLIAYS